ncbi:MAG: NAD(P)/FAD-dependent oxidoreductase [Cryomorphaceae bacterium]|nr:MAG: NAD(P)/FAD-dependent oxidoreductase [Cryomorphaceae bacterium]
MTQNNTTNAQSPEALGLRSQYDAIVIGAGVSGLTSAAMLSRAGLSVLVLESDARPGGYLAGFRRKDFRFDSAIHWLNQMGPQGLVTRVFDLIGKDHPRAKQQRLIKRYITDKHNYLLTDHPDEMKTELIRDFPHERKGIERFFHHAYKLGSSFAMLGYTSRTDESMRGLEYGLFMLKKLKFALPFIPHIRFNGPEGVVKGLKRYFSDPDLLDLFCSEMDILSCLVPIGWAYHADYQLPPEGGSQVLPEWLCHVMDSFGNDVQFKAQVRRISLKNNMATGCSFEHRGKMYEVKSDYVLAACDVQALYEKMLPKEVVPEKMKHKLNQARLYSSSVTLSIALDCPVEELGFGEEMVYLAETGISRDEHANGNPHTSDISLLAPSLRDPSLAPAGKGTLTVYVPAYFQQDDYWHTERSNNGEFIRGEAYKLHKQEYADILLERIEKRLAPGLRSHIEYCDIATPITHWRYTQNRDGSMMGARPGKENYKAGIAHYRTPVKNLILGGHWAELGGGVPIAVRAAANAALLLLQDAKHPAGKLIANYMDGKISLEEASQSSHWLPYNEDWQREPTPAEKKAMRREVKP